MQTSRDYYHAILDENEAIFLRSSETACLEQQLDGIGKQLDKFPLRISL